MYFKIRAAKLRIDQNPSVAYEMVDAKGMAAPSSAAEFINVMITPIRESIAHKGNSEVVYYVPYGVLNWGTPKDVLHCGFASTPVWILKLKEEFQRMNAKSFSGACMQLKLRGDDVLSEHDVVRYIDPYIIMYARCSDADCVDDVIRMNMEFPEDIPEKHPESGSDSDSEEQTADTLDIIKLIDNMKCDMHIPQQCASLTHRLREFMHCVERCLQAVMIASAHAPPDIHVLKVSDSMSKHRSSTCCVAVANTLAGTLSGTHVYISSYANCVHCVKLIRLCDGLLKQQISAISFVEMCAILSCIAY
jgi:hypothetical protein